MKIYTGRGDQGETGLFGGERIAKDSRRIAAYGQVDELNAVLGWCCVAVPDALAEALRREMARLFVLGSYLATPPGAREKAKQQLPPWDTGALAELEAEIDRAFETLEPLQNFILPGGNEPAARLHLARVVCRRAERAVVELSHEEEVEAGHLAYLNRLSDWLFTLAREANRLDGVADVPWIPER